MAHRAQLVTPFRPSSQFRFLVKEMPTATLGVWNTITLSTCPPYGTVAGGPLAEHGVYNTDFSAPCPSSLRG